MSTVQEQITRIQDARDTLRNKAVDLGIGLTTDKLDSLATKFNAIVNRGAVTGEVEVGSSYTIPAGYHNGAGIITGIAGEGKYKLDYQTVTPLKETKTVTPGDGFYGLGSVTVNPIPDIYQDVSAVTATAADVLTTKIIVGTDGTKIAGSMPSNSAISKVLDATDGNQSVTIPSGYSPAGSVSIVLEEGEATPSDSAQDITPDVGKVLSKVTVNPIPSNYKDTTSATAVAANILYGKTAFISTGAVTGVMTDQGAVAATITGLGTATNDTVYTIPAGYHNGSGTVSLTSNIVDALAAI